MTADEFDSAIDDIATALRTCPDYAWEESLTEGIDIMICLDISGSMGAEDFRPKDRLTVAKQVVREFVASRQGDRIGMVVFSGAAMVRSPLTSDHAMLGVLIDAVELNSLPDGTAIGVAIANGAARLRESAAKSKVMLLVVTGVGSLIHLLLVIAVIVLIVQLITGRRASL